MNDNKQPRELSLSQSHTMGPSGLRFAFQKHTVPVQTTMTTAYTQDHLQVSAQGGALKENKERGRLRVTLFGLSMYAVTIGGVTMYRLQNTHTLTALRLSVYLIILPILNFISVPNEIFVGICNFNLLISLIFMPILFRNLLSFINVKFAHFSVLYTIILW